MRKAGTDLRGEMVTCNSAPAVLLYLGEALEAVITVEIIDDKIAHFYVMRNPHKLRSLAVTRAVSRDGRSLRIRRALPNT
jgi:RNA polymerase sigma-70 factor (ECF subfamily)